MDTRILTPKPHKHEKEEVYPEPIKTKADKVEAHFSGYVAKKLDRVNKKLLERGEEIYRKLTTVGKAIYSSDDINQSDFDLDNNLLTPMLDLGIKYQYDSTEQALESEGKSLKEINALFGVNFNIERDAVKYIGLLRARKDYLARTLEETTLKRAYEIIENGVRDGLTYEQIALKMQKDPILGFSQTRANRIARTEANWALNEGARVYLEGLGFERYRIVLANDACQICRNVAKVNQGERESEVTWSIKDGSVVPIHPNCRCVIVGVIPDKWLSVQAPNIQITENFIPKDEELQISLKLESMQPDLEGKTLNQIVQEQRQAKSEGSVYDANRELEQITTSGDDHETMKLKLEAFINKWSNVDTSEYAPEQLGIINSSLNIARMQLKMVEQALNASPTSKYTKQEIDKAVDRYQEFGFGNVNEFLRETDPEMQEILSEGTDVLELADKVSTAIDNYEKPITNTLYRGDKGGLIQSLFNNSGLEVDVEDVDLLQSPDLLKNLKGLKYKDAGFVSTSADKDIAERFMGDFSGSTLIEIAGKKNALRVADITYRNAEKEYLLQRDSVFEVVGYEIIEGAVPYLKLIVKVI